MSISFCAFVTGAVAPSDRLGPGGHVAWRGGAAVARGGLSLAACPDAKIETGVAALNALCTNVGALKIGDAARALSPPGAGRIPLAALVPGPTDANLESFTPDPEAEPEPCGASINPWRLVPIQGASSSSLSTSRPEPLRFASARRRPSLRLFAFSKRECLALTVGVIRATTGREMESIVSALRVFACCFWRWYSAA